MAGNLSAHVGLKSVIKGSYIVRVWANQHPDTYNQAHRNQASQMVKFYTKRSEHYSKLLVGNFSVLGGTDHMIVRLKATSSV